MRYRRARPKVSFALAIGMLFLIALVLSGVLRLAVDLSPLQNNPQLVALGLVFAILASLLLYEW